MIDADNKTLFNTGSNLRLSKKTNFLLLKNNDNTSVNDNNKWISE